jgi:hypothetical protein
MPGIAEAQVVLAAIGAGPPGRIQLLCPTRSHGTRQLRHWIAKGTIASWPNTDCLRGRARTSRSTILSRWALAGRRRDEPLARAAAVVRVRVEGGGQGSPRVEIARPDLLRPGRRARGQADDGRGLGRRLRESLPRAWALTASLSVRLRGLSCQVFGPGSPDLVH